MEMRELGRSGQRVSALGPGCMGTSEFYAGRAENLQRNVSLNGKVEKLARSKNCTPAQLALARVLSKGKDIVVIPGTKRRSYLDQNLGALEIWLTPEDQMALDDAIAPGGAAGQRHRDGRMRTVNL